MSNPAVHLLDTDLICSLMKGKHSRATGPPVLFFCRVVCRTGMVGSSRNGTVSLSVRSIHSTESDEVYVYKVDFSVTGSILILWFSISFIFSASCLHLFLLCFGFIFSFYGVVYDRCSYFISIFLRYLKVLYRFFYTLYLITHSNQFIH